MTKARETDKAQRRDRVGIASALVPLWLGVFAAPLAAEDRVTIRSDSGAGKIILSGRIVDWTGESLTIRSGEQRQEIKSDRVVHVQSPRLQEHLDGQKAFDAGTPDKATELLTQALAKEPRGWMRREILRAMIRADLARGDRAAAGTDFLALLSSDPTTQHFALLPLDWGTVPPEPAIAVAARLWIRPGNSETERLLGASTLLFDPSEETNAAEVLNRLASSIDPRIYPLARAQLWRRSLARGSVPDGEIERWENRVGEMPEAVRGGVYALIGRGWADAGQPERAAAALLWLPLVYNADARLAADSAVTAGDELMKIGRTADAIVLYREAVKRFPYTPAAARAETALERLASQSRPMAAPDESPSSSD